MIALLVLIGGAGGAVLRYLLDTQVKRRFGSAFPWGTLTVNLLGAGLLGALHGAGVGSAAEALLGTGFCGALTTFSTFQVETFQLARGGEAALAIGYPAASIAAGMAVAVAGAMIARWGRHW